MRSLNGKVHILENLIEEKPIQVICLTETWYNEEKLELLNIKGYTPCSSFCRKAHGGGGVCILLRDEYEYKKIKEIETLSVEMIFEICAIELSKFDMLIINLYWPDSDRGKEIFYNSLEKLLNLLSTKYKHKNIVLGGDFNVDFSNNNKKKLELQNLVLTSNFHQLVNEPTRITSTTSTCLDLIFVNFKKNKCKVIVDEFGCSDHKGVILSTPFRAEDPPQFSFLKRFFNEKNIENFKVALMDIDWNKVIKPERDINANYNLFLDTLQTLLNKYIPFKKVKQKTKFKKPYLTVGIRISCQNKRYLKLLTSQTNNSIIQTHYKNYTKTLKKTVKISKKQQNIRKFQNSNNKTKTMWNIIKSETNKNQPRKQHNINLKINNVLIDDSTEVSNIFNSFFSNIGNNKLRVPTQIPRAAKYVENTFYLEPIGQNEVLNIIKRLKTKNSFGIDEIPPKLVKECKEYLTFPYTLLINQSFKEGVFPDALKISLIKPIHKKGDMTNPNNYRPIALLPTSSKIFEAAMANRLTSFYEKYSILHDCQHGFRKNRSTVLAVYKYFQNIYDILNNRKYAIGLLLDMSKAYDRVNYKILLNKLYDTGIRGIAHEWFKSYLSNRSQMVEVNNTNEIKREINNIRSDLISIKGSIPQGSVLGCTLFLIYINDFPNILNHKCTLFADDISVITSISSTTELTEKLDNILDTTTNWLRIHNLELNLTKTKLIQFRPFQRNKIQFTYKHKNTPIEMINSATLLGIEIDSTLTWKKHVQTLARKLSSFIYALRNLKRVTDFKTSLSAYYAYAHSIISYGIILWGNCTDIGDIFILQKKCIRILTNINQMQSCKPLFIQHGILTLTSIYILEACKFVRKHKTLYTFLTTLKRKNRNLRKLETTFTNLKLVDTSPHYMTIKLYNNLPLKIRDIAKDTDFEKTLKHILIKKCYYSIIEYISDKNFEI